MMMLWKIIVSVVMALSIALSATSAPVEYESQEQFGPHQEENEYQDENGYQDKNVYQDKNEYYSMSSTTKKLFLDEAPTLPPGRKKHILEFIPPYLLVPFLLKGKKPPKGV
ncbi:hypothetical protein J6590_108420 [Homalodisca vitripennis]|nr:hypothetical protein J6590_108420 [Homalodisca vitripennis]